jgi:serine/threonine protein kinase
VEDITMKPEHWRQIEQLYHAALERAEAERSAFLDEACAGDEALRREVESLLAFDKQAEQFIEAPPDDVATSMLTEEQARSMVGRTLGAYQVLSLLGAGGMGEVYLARDMRLGRKVAIKLLPTEFTQDRERVWRFKQEARAASALNHPNILTIFEIGQAGGWHFIATEYIEGQTLRERTKRAPLPLREALEVAVQVASALTAAHEAGIVHRDIKPENIMLRRDGYVKVLDFGLAKLIEPLRSEVAAGADSETSAWEQVSTDPGRAIGTPRYMSPEQIRGQEVDGRSDIFSLGVALYEVVAGRAPFEGATPMEVVAAILGAEAPPLERYLREAPAELERIVSKSLRKDREERYQTAKDLLIDLKNLKLELELEAKLKRTGRMGSHSDATLIDQPLVISSFDAAAAATSSQESLREQLEPIGGAVPLGSEFYLVRPADDQFQSAIARQDSIVLVKGARQVGKTSLLARGLQQAREMGARVVITDFQKLTAAYLETVEKLFPALAESFADQLDLDVFPHQTWDRRLSPGVNFERYLRRVVFAKVSSPVVWGLDEVDRLFTCDFASEVFGLFRSWHNERALDPQGPWRRFTLAIAYATEAHLFITDLNQSPFNVGTRLALGDFTFEQVAELNRRYGSPLRDRAEVARYFRLVGGHPYLVRRGLHEMVAQGLKLVDLEAQAADDEGPFGDHLRRLFVSLTHDAALCEVVRGALQGQPCPSPESFYRLRSAGLMVGDSTRDVRPRCQLYATYLEKHLL